MSMNQLHHPPVKRRVKQVLGILLSLTALAASLEAQTVNTVLSYPDSQPVGVAVDLNQELYYTLGLGIDPVSVYDPSTGVLSPVVLAGSSQLVSPVSFTLWNGGLVVADSGLATLQYVDVNSGEVTSRWTNTWLNPSAVTADASGNVFVADWNGVFALTPSNTVVTLATNISRASALTLGQAGKLWVADAANNVVKLLELNGLQVTNVIVIGKWGTPGYTDSGTATSALFNQPRGLLWVGGQTGLLVSDYRNNVIRSVSYSTSRKSWGVTTWATGFASPLGLSRDNTGVTLVADSKSGQILSVTQTSQSAPTMTPPSGSYSNAIVVNFGSALASSTTYEFHYTFDGQTPTLQSPVGNALTLDGYDRTVSVRCFSPDYATSATTTNSYAFFVSPPVSSSIDTTTNRPVTVALTTATQGAEIYWTQDGSEPSAANGTRYTGPFTVLTNGALKYIGLKPGYASSAVLSNLFDLTVSDPVISPGSASATDSFVVTITSATPNASIHWTIDGSDPTTNSTLYNGPFVLSQAGTIKAKAYFAQLTPSQVVLGVFDLHVGDITISPSGISTNNSLVVTLGTSTPGAAIYWTTNGTEPTTNSMLYTGPFLLEQAVAIKAKGFRDGFTPSLVALSLFDLQVASPIITPEGSVTNNAVTVSLASATPGAAIYWTIDGTIPGPGNGFLYTGPFVLDGTGILFTKAYRDGFVPSLLSNGQFSFEIFQPSASVVAGTYVGLSSQTPVYLNSVTVALTDDTAGARIYYMLDGTTATTSSTLYTGPITSATNIVLTAMAAKDNYISRGDFKATTIFIQLDKPVLSPSSGYFPSGVSVTLAMPRPRPNAVIYYTTDGSTPSTNSTKYTGPFQISGDISKVRAIAVAPNTVASDVAVGQAISANQVGVPRDMKAGIGSTIVIPVVVDVAAGQKVRSLQFRLDIVPSSPGAPVMDNYIDAMAMGTNDFVPLAADSTDNNPITYLWLPYSWGVTNGGLYACIATNLIVTNYSTIANLKLKMPTNALEGDTYTIQVSQVSGTSDANQQSISIQPLPDRTLTIARVPYMAGDCATGDWYNAGDFGDGVLDNADVNAVFLASVGIHTPEPGTDAYYAMDVYPETPNVIGNGLITFLDWEHVLLRSVGLESAGWVRWWGNGGVLSHSNILGNTFSQTQLSAPGLVSDAANGWLRHALVAGDTVTQVIPGTSCSIPVYVKVLPGFQVSGLQFIASLEPQSGAPYVSRLAFSSAESIPAPSLQLAPASNRVACAWALGSFSKPLQGSNLLGYVTFIVPATAQSGQSYTLRISYPGGAADQDTELTLESAPGHAWVLSAPSRISSVVSDDWKTNYFGSTTSADADGDADPDHDGVPNWQEYLAGTNPLDATSLIKFSHISAPDKTSPVLALQWETVAGRVYIIETCSTLNGGIWTTASETFRGNGEIRTFNQTNLTGTAQFYRLKLQNP